MKSVLQRTEKNLDKLEKLETIYLVGYWTKAGVREFWYANMVNKDGIPLVYQYDDHNGTTDQYELKPITYTTTGLIYCWTFNKDKAEFIAECINKALDKDTNN